MSLSSLWQWLFNAWIIGEIVISVATRTRRGQGDLQDRGTQFILWIVIVLSMTACGFLRHFQPLPVHVDHASMRLAALALLSAGLLVRVAAILTLGKSFSVSVPTRIAARMAPSISSPFTTTALNRMRTGVCCGSNGTGANKSGISLMS